MRAACHRPRQTRGWHAVRRRCHPLLRRRCHTLRRPATYGRFRPSGLGTGGNSLRRSAGVRTPCPRARGLPEVGSTFSAREGRCARANPGTSTVSEVGGTSPVGIGCSGPIGVGVAHSGTIGAGVGHGEPIGLRVGIGRDHCVGVDCSIRFDAGISVEVGVARGECVVTGRGHRVSWRVGGRVASDAAVVVVAPHREAEQRGRPQRSHQHPRRHLAFLTRRESAQHIA